MRLAGCLAVSCGVVLVVGTASAECVGDLDGSGEVDFRDILELLGGWGDPYGVEDLLLVLGDWGCTVAPGVDQVGIFSAATNYFELDLGTGEALKFHFGSQMSVWGARAHAVAGDFDGAGADTVGVFDLAEGTFLLADENDSDEFAPRGTEIFLTDVPPVPPPDDGPPPRQPVVGDWDGDGVDGVGLYYVATNTFYLRNIPTTGPPDHVVLLDPAEGFPPMAYAIAGDFDGNGVAEVGLVCAGVAYLTNTLVDPPLHLSFTVPGSTAIAGDFDADGIDTIAVLDGSSNVFTILEQNAEGSPTSTRQFGYAEPGFWGWGPLAGNWQVPAAPVAGQGFEWPIGDPVENGVNPESLAAALDDIGLIENVQAVLVIRNGELLAERHFHGFDRHIAQNIKSVSKSVLSAIFGAAFDRGLIASLDDTVAAYMPAYFEGLGEGKRQITIEDIMTMRGGLFAGPTTQQYNQGLMASDDYVEYVLEQELVSTPGTVFVYSTGLSHLGSAMLTEAVGTSTRAFAREHLFEPIGISTPRWDGSPEGYDFGGAEMWMRPRDLARFGQLFLRHGAVGDRQILSSEWVGLSAHPWVPESGGRRYGLWWRERPWAHYPFDDSYFGWGHGGQFVLLFPTWDFLVVVNAKWGVPYQEAGQVATTILTFVDNQVLTAVED